MSVETKHILLPTTVLVMRNIIMQVMVSCEDKGW